MAAGKPKEMSEKDTAVGTSDVVSMGGQMVVNFCSSCARKKILKLQERLQSDRR